LAGAGQPDPEEFRWRPFRKLVANSHGSVLPTARLSASFGGFFRAYHEKRSVLRRDVMRYVVKKESNDLNPSS
jgi:hypothetical protein